MDIRESKSQEDNLLPDIYVHEIADEIRRSKSTFTTTRAATAVSKGEFLDSSPGLDGRYSTYSTRPQSKADKKDNEFNPEVEATNERYAQLQAIFEAADEDGLPGLTIDEFKRALRNTVGYNMTENQIELLFMKVDANCDGTVDWEEYVTYNLLEYKERTHMIEMLRDRPFPPETKEIPSRHRETIVRVAVYPTVHKKASHNCVLDYNTGRFVSLSKEGIISFWTPKMKLIKSHMTHPNMDRATHPWLTDFVCLYNVNMIAVSSTDRDIIIFDIQANKFMKRYHIVGIDSCITVMDYWADLKDLNHSVLLIGDTSGCVYIIVFDAALKGGLFGAIAGKRTAFKKVSIAEVLRGFQIGVKGYRMGKLHDNWVSHLQYIPNLNLFASCSQTSETSLYLGDFVKKKMNSYFKVNKGLLTFDYCPEHNVLVTGGMDYFIRIWNPYVNSKPINVLKGHTKPITHLIVNSPRNQIISVDKGKNIKVFDMKDQTCLQQLSGRVVKLGPLAISSMCFNPATQKLVLATSQLALLERRDEDERVIDVYSHHKPVASALYNKVFKTVVSACRGSVVSVWELNTGEKVIQFVNAHKRIERGVEYPVEITTMTFDGPGRRLITGARDGSVKVWNFNNGACLQQFDVPGALTITAIVSTHHRIYVTGWCQLVHVYVDGGGEEFRKNWRSRHTDDILCMSHMNPNIMATGSYNGDVIIWSRDTGQVYCKLNAFKGTKPITDNARQVEDDVEDDSQDVSDEGEPSSPTWKTSKATKAVRTGIGLLQKVRHGLTGNGCNTKQQDPERNIVSPLNHPLLSSFDSKEDSVSSKRDEYDEICKNYEAAVEHIIFLPTRDSLHKETASLVTCGSEGWIRFWSLHHQGGLLGQFNAAHSVGESVHAMVTDEKDEFLITADTSGYIKIWDITEYCIKDKGSSEGREKRWKYLLQTFTYLHLEWRGKDMPKIFTSFGMRPHHIGTRPPPLVTEPQRTMQWPLLVNSFRAHTKMITTVEFVDDKKVIITASVDCAIRVWTINGVYIGTFGEFWDPIDSITSKKKMDSEARIPRDLRRVGSAKTLRVLNAGLTTPKWKVAMDMVKTRQLPGLQAQLDLLHMKEDTQAKSDDERTERKLETSNILGKSYRRKVRYKIPQNPPKIIETPTSIAVYHALPFVELTDLSKMFDAKMMQEMKIRRFGGSLVSRFKGPPKKKPNEPAIIELFSQVSRKATLPVPKYKKQPAKMKKIHTSLREKMKNNLPPVMTPPPS